jgi:hypothetical protein
MNTGNTGIDNRMLLADHILRKDCRVDACGSGRRHSPSEVLKLGDLREAVVVGLSFSLRKEQLFIKHFKQKWVQYLSNCTEVMSTLVFSFNQWVAKRVGCHSFSFQVISAIQSSMLNYW